MDSPTKGRSDVRSLIQGFIDDRLATKLEKLAPDDPKYQKLQHQFDYENWITAAARRVSQLQVVTHSLKGVHPEAKGTNLFASPDSLPPTDLISSRLLQDGYTVDVVGNAAVLDVYKFLKLEYEGKTLLELALENDPRFVEALNDNPSVALEQAEAFAGIVQSSGVVASSTRAKQIYWLTGDTAGDNSHYHLLSPLYPTSLVHKVYQTIQEHRFGDVPKAARQARREGKVSETGYQDYPHLAVQKLGGTQHLI
jgi:CRISPR-associated protein Csy1